MENTFSERFNKLLNDKGITAYRVAKDLALSQSSVSNYKSGGTPNASILKLISKYLEVSEQWLLKGDGEIGQDDRIMFKVAPRTVEEPQAKYQTNNTKTMEKDYDERIRLLEKQIENLERELKSKDEQIALMRELIETLKGYQVQIKTGLQANNG